MFSRKIEKNSQKIEEFLKNRKCCQKSKIFVQKATLFSKIEIFVKNRNFRQKSEFLSKIEIFVKNRNFRQKSKFSSKIEIFVKNRNFRQKSKFSSKIEISVNKIEIFVKIEMFVKNNCLYLAKIQIPPAPIVFHRP